MAGLLVKSVLAALLLAVVAPIPLVARAVDGDSGSVSGSDGAGSIVVRGESGGDQRRESGDGAKSQVRVVSCDAATRSSPALADGCASAGVACAVTKDDSAGEQVAVVRQQQSPNREWSFAGTDCLTPEPAQVTAAMVRERVVRLVPTAAVGLAPHGTSLVNIETVMWADAPAGRSLPVATILGRSVSIRLRLDHVAWVFGDGGSDVDGPAGRAYDGAGDPCRSRQCPQYFGHTYVRTGAMTVRATVSWTASFSVDGGAVVDIPGTVEGPASEARLLVRQARGVLVPNPGEH